MDSGPRTLLLFLSLISFRDRDGAPTLPAAGQHKTIKMTVQQRLRSDLTHDGSKTGDKKRRRSRDHVQSLRPNSEPLEPRSPWV